MADRKLLRLTTNRLVEPFHPQRIILFGSQARGTAEDRSDVDLLALCAFDKRPGNRRTLMVAMERALHGLGFTARYPGEDEEVTVAEARRAVEVAARVQETVGRGLADEGFKLP
ncbi:MAG: nucleotidyltransferase domain-containing protein [Terriglobia bacterium]